MWDLSLCPLLQVFFLDFFPSKSWQISAWSNDDPRTAQGWIVWRAGSTSEGLSTGREVGGISEWLRNFGSGSLLFCHGFIICIYICNLWDYLFNLPRQESHFFAAWFHLVWKNDLGRTQLFVQVGQQINRRLIPKVSTSNIHNYIYTRIYVYIYIWYCMHICIRVIDMYTISYIYI